MIRYSPLIAVLIALLPLPARAQLPPETVAARRQLAQVEADVRSVDRAMDARVEPDERAALHARVATALTTTAAATAQVASQLALVDARLKGLGAATAGEAPEIARQRAALMQERSALDATLRRGNLAQVEARQLGDELDRSAAEQFAQALSTRVASPVTPAFWGAVLQSVPRDLKRIALFASQGAEQVRARAHAQLPWAALLGAILAALLLFPVRVRARAAGRRFLIEGAPGHRVRRSGFAVWQLLTGTLFPLLAGVAVVQGFRWSGLVPVRWDGLADGLIVAIGFGAFTASVTGALLMRSQPTWRVAPIDDDTADRLRPLSWMLAALAGASLLVGGFNAAVGASRAAQVVTEAVTTLLYVVLIASFLLTLGRIRAGRGERVDDDETATTRAGLGLVELVAWVAVGVASVALVIGYVGLAVAIVRFMAWSTVLGSTAYLVARAVDDVVTTLFTRQSRLGRTLSHGLGLRGSAVDQFGLVLSGSARIVIVLAALGMLFTPFGGSGGLSAILARLGALSRGIELGGVSISPGTILRGAVVFAVGLALVRGFMRWLENRYLPVTDLDGSARNSVSLISRYAGIALASIWALASLGVGIERIALLLSALSVGIGFGLQAITQNFVSGLILLAERPIKIGDLVRVGTDEGDVKRISVRSTEIELGDHSTLIVPNSEFITKTVLNKTLASPLGRVQIQFSVPIGEDADRVRDLLLDAYAGEEAILDAPSPAVFVDSIADGRIVFNSFAHVVGPRAAYAARSAVFLQLLRKLRAEGIAIGTVPQRLELVTDTPPTSPHPPS